MDFKSPLKISPYFNRVTYPMSGPDLATISRLYRGFCDMRRNGVAHLSASIHDADGIEIGVVRPDGTVMGNYVRPVLYQPEE